MEIIVSSVIGGQLKPEVEMEKNLHQIIIEMRKNLKKQFLNISFEGLAKIKINLYISGDVSEYSSKSGITKCRYFQKKNELVSEFCIDRYYWNSEPMLDTKKEISIIFREFVYKFRDLIKEN